MQNDDKQKTLFGYPVVEVEMKNIPENPKIVFGDMSAYVTWRIRKRHLTQRAADGLRRIRIAILRQKIMLVAWFLRVTRRR